MRGVGHKARRLLFQFLRIAVQLLLISLLNISAATDDLEPVGVRTELRKRRKRLRFAVEA
jgi:hypothetical protein